MVFCLVTLHLWVRILKMFPELRDLSYVDDDNIIGQFSQELKLTVVNKLVFNLDGNLDFNMGKTMILTKDPTARHVYERTQHLLQNDPDLQVIVDDFTPEMFSVQGIQVMGNPLVTDTYIRNFVPENCTGIGRNVLVLNPSLMALPIFSRYKSV